ncbi:MAG: cell surface protein SprA, partial [Prevotella sp.]|nr:cell surface protein SprA [Prevotella sp.]
FKKLIKSNSKWFDILKKFGFNWLPQNVSFNTEITRHYHELQERDMEDLGGSQLPLIFSEQFLWNRDFSIRWDLTKNIHMNFQSATHAEIEEPYTPINKDLYPDQYSAWKDSVKTSLRHFGTPLDYNQSFKLSYQLPLNLIPIFDWVNADANYTSTYRWIRGTDLDDGTSLGNTISNSRDLNINGAFNMERLYNQIPFLKKTNERFNKAPKKTQPKKTTASNTKKGNDDKGKEQKELPKNQRSFEKEITLLPDTTISVSHGRKSKRLIVSAKTSDGKTFRLRYRTDGQDKIKIISKVDTATKVKITVTAKPSLEDKGWYKTAQCVARVLMMVRSVNVSYRNHYAMSLPGFLPQVGDIFGQRRGDIMSPGLDFAFGLIGDGYLNKAVNNGWLLMVDSVATPATTNQNVDLQIRMTLEPIRNLKIDLSATRTDNKSRSIQYMYDGRPTTQSGTFTMTTISLKSAFEGIGSANSGYHSATFERFCRSLEGFRNRVETQYEGAPYPANSTLAGETYSSANEKGRLGIYSADVMIPAFLSAYTSSGGKALSIFPKLARLLPNWTIRYSGLSQLPWFSDVFKSVNLNHAYKSVYSVGSYSTYSTFQEYMNGLGFINDATQSIPVPSSMFNVSTVSITEAFSPLLGIDVTLMNNMTCKLEYRKTRNLSLSMTSVQISEAYSNDWVIGMGYKISDFRLFGGRNHRAVKSNKKGNDEDQQNNTQRQNTSKSKGISHDLNLRLDISYRRQASIVRDIATMTSSASSGNTAFKLAFNADYTLSRLLTMSFYYDRQTNTPLLTSSSYPTTTQDFGLSLKFSLTR